MAASDGLGGDGPRESEIRTSMSQTKKRKTAAKAKGTAARGAANRKKNTAAGRATSPKNTAAERLSRQTAEVEKLEKALAKVKAQTGAGKTAALTAAADLERVDLKPRSSRGAVVSVRLTADEAQAVASRAERAALSVSEFARRLLKRSLETKWRLMVWDGTGPLALGMPPQTGGDYARTPETTDATSTP